MQVLSWNVRGLGNEVKVAWVRRMIRKTRANCFLIQESK